MTFEPSAYVRHRSKPEWGPGKVIVVERDIVHVVFRDRGGGPTKIRADFLEPANVDGDVVLDRMHARYDSLPRRKPPVGRGVYPSFTSFVEAKVLPVRNAHPDWRRLDGKDGEDGSRDVFGRFRYRELTWRVHADSHVEPLLIAYEAMLGGDAAPFVEARTQTGERLDLRPELAERTGTYARHLYVYADG